jgi:RNA polymerase sigma-70 factor (ECF subfamily)
MQPTIRREATLQGPEVASLLVRCCAGDRRAWDRLLGDVRRLTLDLARWKYRLSLEDAEDVAQVVQLKVAERLAQLRDPASFGFWVRRLVQRASIDCVRQRRPLVSLDDETSPAHELEASDEASTDYDQILLRADLDRALAKLPDLYREPIRLNVLEGIPQDEVGRILGRPRSTVASQIERGLSRLQRSLAPGLAAS